MNISPRHSLTSSSLALQSRLFCGAAVAAPPIEADRYSFIPWLHLPGLLGDRAPLDQRSREPVSFA